MAKRSRDANQAEIVRALERVGCSVADLSAAGVAGLPDLLVGWQGRNVLLEVKTATGTLSAEQLDWHDRWRGTALVVRTPAEAIRAVCGDLDGL